MTFILLLLFQALLLGVEHNSLVESFFTQFILRVDCGCFPWPLWQIKLERWKWFVCVFSSAKICLFISYSLFFIADSCHFGTFHSSRVIFLFSKSQHISSQLIYSLTLFSLRISIFFISYFILHLLNSLNSILFKSPVEKKRFHYHGNEIQNMTWKSLISHQGTS